MDFQPPAAVGQVSATNTLGNSFYRTPTSNTFAEVVDSGSTPADPFGGANNQSLLLQDNDGVYTQIAWQGAAGGLTAGTFTTQFYVANTTGYTTPYGYIIVGANSSTSQGGPFIELAGTTLRFDKAVGGADVILDNTVTENEIHTLVLNFDAVAHTYTGTLDGDPLTYNSGATTTFNFASSSISDVDSVLLDGGYSTQTGSRIFFDNLSLNAVPEPASLGLLALGTLVLVRRRKESGV
jgi:hypothetical protein